MFEYVPIECHYLLPSINDHKNHEYVVRGARFSPNCRENFYPIAIENPKRAAKFGAQEKCDITLYSVSLYSSIEYFEKDIKKYPKTSEKIKYYAIGKTSSDFGISLPEDSVGHIEYYLYDCYLHNPFEQYTITDRGDQNV